MAREMGIDSVGASLFVWEGEDVLKRTSVPTMEDALAIKASFEAFMNGKELEHGDVEYEVTCINDAYLNMMCGGNLWTN